MLADSDNAPIDLPAGLSGITAIAAGRDHALALRKDGTVVGWGSDTMGQTDIPTGLSGVTAISAGQWFSLALKSNGTVVGWGARDKNHPALFDVGQTTIPAGMSGVTAISAGGDFGLAILGPGGTKGRGPDFSSVVGAFLVLVILGLSFVWYLRIRRRTY